MLSSFYSSPLSSLQLWEVAATIHPILQMSHLLIHWLRPESSATRLMSNSEVPGQVCLPSENALPTTGWMKGRAAVIHDGYHLFVEYTLYARLTGFYLLSAFCMPGSDLSTGLTHLALTATPSCRDCYQARKPRPSTYVKTTCPMPRSLLVTESGFEPRTPSPGPLL